MSYRIPARPLTREGKFGLWVYEYGVGGVLVPSCVVGVSGLITGLFVSWWYLAVTAPAVAWLAVSVWVMRKHTVLLPEPGIGLKYAFYALDPELRVHGLPLYYRGVALLQARDRTGDERYVWAAQERVTALKTLRTSLAVQAHEHLLDDRTDLDAVLSRGEVQTLRDVGRGAGEAGVRLAVRPDGDGGLSCVPGGAGSLAGEPEVAGGPAA